MNFVLLSLLIKLFHIFLISLLCLMCELILQFTLSFSICYCDFISWIVVTALFSLYTRSFIADFIIALIELQLSHILPALYICHELSQLFLAFLEICVVHDLFCSERGLLWERWWMTAEILILYQYVSGRQTLGVFGI